MSIFVDQSYGPLPFDSDKKNYIDKNLCQLFTVILDKIYTVTEYMFDSDKTLHTLIIDFQWQSFCDDLSEVKFLSPARIQWHKKDIKWNKWLVTKYIFGCSVNIDMRTN
jgi:hypothetical protein